jgi:hypothetical protein
MDSAIWIKIVKTASERATPTRINLIESNSRHLECAEVDNTFWRNHVTTKFASRKLPSQIVEPYPASRDNIQNALHCLLEWDEKEKASTYAAFPSGKLCILENTLVSIKLLRETNAGHVVKSLLKTPTLFEEYRERLKNLQKKWKHYHKLWNSTSPIDLEPDLILPHGFSPQQLEEAMEELTTWKKLYYFLESQKQILLTK